MQQKRLQKQKRLAMGQSLNEKEQAQSIKPFIKKQPLLNNHVIIQSDQKILKKKNELANVYMKKGNQINSSIGELLLD